MNQQTGHRKTMIKLIHTAWQKALLCTSCGSLFYGQCLCGRTDGFKLDRVAYEEILQSITGKTSCSEMNIRELADTLRFFNSKGFRNKPFRLEEELLREKEMMIKAIEAKARTLLGTNWEGRLTGFMRSRVGVDSLAFCTLGQLRHIQGFLSTVARKSGGGE